MPQQYSTLILIALMVVAFYFLIMRPQRKRQQAMQRTLNEIQPGTRVLLGSGLFGTVISVGEKQLVLELSPGAEVTVLKQAVVRIATAADEDPVEDDEVDELDDDDLDTTSGTAAGTGTSTPVEPAKGPAATAETAETGSYPAYEQAIGDENKPKTDH
jgi:preprotein translocase subunit YajC